VIKDPLSKVKDKVEVEELLVLNLNLTLNI